MFPRLETERLILRAMSEEDLPAFVRYRSDPDVARYQSWDAPYSLGQAAALLANIRLRPPGTPGEWHQVAIESRATGILVGDCAFCVLKDAPGQAQLGYTLSAEHQHQGYATEAVARLLTYLFEEHHLTRVRASCDAENHPSARLLARLGMRRDSNSVETAWFKGRWATELHCAILREEWMSGRYTG